MLDIHSKAEAMSNVILLAIEIPLVLFDGPASDRLHELLTEALQGLGEGKLDAAVTALLSLDCTYLADAVMGGERIESLLGTALGSPDGLRLIAEL
jgi:hypothetical protein